MKQKVSVIMPAYNAALYIKEAIQSILDQTFTDFELIVINDGSSDETLSCIRSFSDKRIRLISNKKNLGIIASRNIGLDAAEGEYIAKMDADDISLPNRLERQVNYLNQNPDVAVLATKLAIIDSKGILNGVWPEDYYVNSRAQIKATLPRTNCIGQPTVMMRAQTANAIRYNKNYRYNEDWGFWLDVLANGEVIAKLDEVLLYYRVHGRSTTVRENGRNVALKTIRFRTKYLFQNMFKRNSIVFSVSRALALDMMKFFAPTLLLRFFKLLKIGPFKLLTAYVKVRGQLKSLGSSVSHLFFFPFYHSGGAEKVHAGIIETVADNNPLVFITDCSSNSAFLKDFSVGATVAEVQVLLQFGPTYRWLKNQITRMCKQNPNLILFGCNSRFYYECIPSLPETTRTLDLIHAFVHEYEDGPEKWSLSVANRIVARVVISENTKKDLEILYLKNKVDTKLLERVSCITNYVEIPVFETKPVSNIFHVLYVGRGSTEKRIHLISGAARICAQTKLPVLFHFVGDTAGFIPETDITFCKIHNEVFDSKKLNELYKQSHALIIASSREGFPMVIMEAMANMVVPIATKVGGISTHVFHLENGLLIEEKEEQKIIEAIVASVELLLNDKQKWQTLSNSAYLYATQHFKKDVFFNSYRKLLS